MKHMFVRPDGWECKLSECPPGFFVFHEELCLKTEYGTNEAFCSTGERFWGGTKTEIELGQLIVQPVKASFETSES